MVTRNFLNILAMTLESGSGMGCLRCRDVNGNTRFASGISAGTGIFPGSPAQSFTLDAAAPGISIGTGSAPESEDDFNLDQTLASGVSVTITDISCGAENPRFPFLQYALTITNTSANPLVVTEVGYKQTLNTTRLIGSTRREAAVLLLDRCVLDTPVSIAPGDAGIVTYRLQTNPVPTPPVVAGVQMASFAYGTDEQVAAILDAAAAGTIDLQRDAGWRVGDQRVVSVAAFTAGGGEVVPAQNVAVVITSFDEYMGCGNVLQFDFACFLSVLVRMNATSATAGGYGAMEMKTVTLPALAEALPDWLKTRLKTFSVLAGSGGTSVSGQTLETVTGNKLALRSGTELYGDGSRGVPGEGTPVPYYAAAADRRRKPQGIDGQVTAWWLRSAYTSSQLIATDGNGNPFYSYADASWGVAPFGCL